MPAVVRIKRRIDEEPLSAFVLNSKKRRRLDNDEAADALLGSGDGAAALEKEEISTILKFAGTIQEQDNGATTQLARLTKEAAKELVLQKSMRPASNHTERARQEMRQSLHESRFRVVNCLRTTLDNNEADAIAADNEVTILDIEKQEMSASASGSSKVTLAAGNATAQDPNVTAGEQESHQQPQQQTTDSDTGYVYDLYLPENELQVEHADIMDDNYLSIRPFDNLVYEDHYNDDDDEYDSEDSNNENYYANDYPDEEDNDGNDNDAEPLNYSDAEDLEVGMQRLRFTTQDGYLHAYESADSSVSSDSSDDEDYYYAEEDHSHRRRHTPDDDDVDYYDANDDSETSAD